MVQSQQDSVEPDLNGFRYRTVLVTGARGFLGHHLCDELLRQGAVLHASSRAPHSSDGRETWHLADTRDPETWTSLLERVQPEVVFHLAGYVHGGRALEHVVDSLQQNCVATVNLLKAATELGNCRIVLANSLEEPSASEVASAPCSPYAASKFASTLYARMFHSLYGTPVVITRISMGYGPGQWDLRKLVPYVILSLLQGKAPDLSSGNRRCDWVYSDDVASGLLAAALSSRCAGQTIDIASGKMTSIRTVALKIVELLGSSITPNFGVFPDRPLERLRPPDIEHTHSLTGWRPSISLHEGLARTVEWYRTQFDQGVLAEKTALSLAGTERT